MKADLLDLLCCPRCHCSLKSLDNTAQITEGNLVCTVCSATYDVVNGIPHVFVDDERWHVKAREIDGWISILDNLFTYYAADHELYQWIEGELAMWRATVRPRNRLLAGLATKGTKLPRRWAILACLALRDEVLLLSGKKP